MRYSKILAVTSTISLSLAQSNCTTTSASDVDYSNLTVALIRAPPPNWPLPLLNYNYSGITFNISEAVDAGIDLINEAAANNANLVLFPELWFPGFPKGSDVNNWTETHLPSYLDNCLVIGEPLWNRLIAGIRDAGVYAGLAFAEMIGDNVFMSQALISPTGDILAHRHKLRPSGAERYIFSDGTTDGLRVVTSAYGRVGMLECGEHYYPAMTFITQAQKENLHIGPFPYLADPGDSEALWWEDLHSNMGAGETYAVNSGAYVMVPAVGGAFVIDPLANVVAQMNASADFDKFPMLYANINTTSFNTSETYDIDGQNSWGILQEIVAGYPDYIPRIEGAFVVQKNVSVAWMKTGALTI